MPQLCDLMQSKLPSFISSGHIEVQERASSASMLVQMLRQEFVETAAATPMTDDILQGIDVNAGGPANDGADIRSEISLVAIEIVQEMALLFAGDLNPVAPKAQRKVPVPDGLDLDAWINEPPPMDGSSSSDDEPADLFVSAYQRRHGGGVVDDSTDKRRTKTKELTDEERAKVRE